MTIRDYFTPSNVRLCVVSAALMLGSITASQGAPSQSPLLSRTGGGVSPNLVLDMDDSGSMGYQHMPEGLFTVAGKSVVLAGNYSLLMHPLDPRSSTNYRGIWPADTGATGAALLYQQQMRSPDVNTLYYNPETTYLPWMNEDNLTRFPVANPVAASFNALTPATGGGTVRKPYFVSAGAKSDSGSGNTTPGLPAGWAQNDLVICLAESADSVVHSSASTGWTRLYSLQASANHSASAFYQLAGAALSAPVITHTGGDDIVAQCYAYRNVDLVSPFDVVYGAGAGATSDDTSDSTIESGTVTTATANTLLLFASHQADNFSSLSVSSAGGLGWVQAGVANFNGDEDVGVAMHYADKVAIGPIGPLVVTSNQTGRNSGVLLALRAGAAFVSSPVANGVDLTAATSNITANWCATAPTISAGPPATSTGNPACATSSKSYTPMLFYRLKTSSPGVYLDPTVSANYDSYDLTNDLKNGVASAAPQTYANRSDCTAGVCSLEQEKINYANWWVYHRNRMMVAQSAVAESFASIPETKLRVGWGYINKGSGTLDNGETVSTLVAGVRDFSTARKTAMFSFMRNLAPAGSTPLQAAMIGVGEYYRQASPWFDDPGNSAVAIPAGSQPKTCRRAYHLLVTDGLWSGHSFTAAGNYDSAGTYETILGQNLTYTYVPKPPYSDANSNYLADYASYYFNRDLRPTLDNDVQKAIPGDLFWQGMINFTVGIGLSGTLNPATDLPGLIAGTTSWPTNKVDDLWHAAINSEGKFFTAKNSKQLAESLTSALTTTLQNELREAGVATASTVLEEGNRKYIPFYKTGVWSGDIRAFELGGNGQVVAGPGPEGELWAAGSKLPAWADRNIYTWNESAGTASLFTWATMGALNQAAIGPTAGSSPLVDYLRGDATNENGTYRTRKTRLGDFINSNPVLVKAGADLKYQSLSVGGGSYNSYRAAKALRDGVLFIGANDGMLHAFSDAAKPLPQANDGKEIFAYVPRAVYPNLSILADTTYGSNALYHQFYVDGALSETDAYVSGGWRNYVMGSLGAGGRAVFAIDATDMTAPSAANVKWEFSNDVDLGYVSTTIEVGVLPDGTWVAIFGNGPLSPSGKAVLFVVNLATGAASKLEVNAGPSNGLGGVGVLRDTSGYIKSLYAGDLSGKLWKLDYDAGAAAPHFVVTGGNALFTATSASSVAQPITQPPALFAHSLGGNLVVFGTGKLLEEADRTTTDTQTMYAVWDMAPTVDSEPRPMTRSLLEPRQFTRLVGAGNAVFYGATGSPVLYGTAASPGPQRGWVMDMTLIDAGVDVFSGERIIYPPQKATSTYVLFSAVSPAQSVEVCGKAEGSGANFIVPVETGLPPPNTAPLFDTDGNGVVNSSDGPVFGYATKVDGIDSVVQGADGDVGTPGGGGGECPAGTHRSFIENTTGAVLVCLPDSAPVPASSSVIKDRIWGRIINPPIR